MSVFERPLSLDIAAQILSSALVCIYQLHLPLQIKISPQMTRVSLPVAQIACHDAELLLDLRIANSAKKSIL